MYDTYSSTMNAPQAVKVGEHRGYSLSTYTLLSANRKRRFVPSFALHPLSGVFNTIDVRDPTKSARTNDYAFGVGITSPGNARRSLGGVANGVGGSLDGKPAAGTGFAVDEDVDSVMFSSGIPFSSSTPLILRSWSATSSGLISSNTVSSGDITLPSPVSPPSLPTSPCFLRV